MKVSCGKMVSFCSGLLLLVALAESGPLNFEHQSQEVVNNTLVEYVSAASRGCRYKAKNYANGEEVTTAEPCLSCHCKGAMVVCRLRICPEMPVPPPPGCIVVHKAKSCCSQLICHGYGIELAKKISREQKFPVSISNETLLASVSDEAGYCVRDGTVYAEGSAMRPSTLCEYCFCIRGQMRCSKPECVIPLKGCTPHYRSYACCPTNYECEGTNQTSILQTMSSSTQVPDYMKGCLVRGHFVPEGEPVLPVLTYHIKSTSNKTGSTICRTCFCMGGVIHCKPLECDQPIEGCTPIREPGHCCPDRYNCTKIKSTTPKPALSSSTTETSSSTEEKDNSPTTTPVSSSTELQSFLTEETLASSTESETLVQSTSTEALTSFGETETPVQSTETLSSSTEQFSSTLTPFSSTSTQPFSTTLLTTLLADLPSSTSATEVTSNESLAEEDVTSASTSERPTITELSESTPIVMTSTMEESLEDLLNKTISTALTFTNKTTPTALAITKDSFERVATVSAGSSEEAGYLIPVHILPPVRVTATLGGFKNRSDLGSREERRSKDADELALRHSTEDDERDELMYPGFETTISNVLEDLGIGATTSFEDLSYNPSESDSMETDAPARPTFRLENVTENYISLMENEESSVSPQNDNMNEESSLSPQNDNVNEEDLAVVSTEPDTTVTSTTVQESPSTIQTTQHPLPSKEETAQPETTVESVNLTTTSPTETSEIHNASTTTESGSTTNVSVSEIVSTTLITPVPTTTTITTSPPETAPESENSSSAGYLQFIPFVEEDALIKLENDTSPVNPAKVEESTQISNEEPVSSNSSLDSLAESLMALLRPLELKFMNGTEEKLVPEELDESDPTFVGGLPVLVEKEDSHAVKLQYNISGLTGVFPISSSLYNNGYYPHGGIDTDDGPNGELVISEGELNQEAGDADVDDEDDELDRNSEKVIVKLNLNVRGNKRRPQVHLTEEVSPSPPTKTTPSSEATKPKSTEGPLMGMTSNDKFMPAYPPSTAAPLPGNHPSRIYSKFGLQDSPFHRYGAHNPSPFPIDSSGFVRQAPPPQHFHHRYFNEPEQSSQTRVQTPSNNYGPSGAPGVNMQTNDQGQSVGMLPPIYKNKDKDSFYEDSSAAVDSYEDYDTDSAPPSPNGLPLSGASSTSTPKTTTPPSYPTIQFLGERGRLPSYNQQRTTPKYQFAVKPTQMHQFKTTTPRTSTPAAAPPGIEYGAKPLPFNLPTNRGNVYNLGFKLSGCNVVGKMYRVGQIIEELSTACLQCMCSELGVHCGDVKCE